MLLKTRIDTSCAIHSIPPPLQSHQHQHYLTLSYSRPSTSNPAHRSAHLTGEKVRATTIDDCDERDDRKCEEAKADECQNRRMAEYVNVVLRKVKDNSDKLVKEMAKKIDCEVEKKRQHPTVSPSSFLKRFKMNIQRIRTRQHHSQSELSSGCLREGIDMEINFRSTAKKMEQLTGTPGRVRRRVLNKQVSRMTASSMSRFMGMKGSEFGIYDVRWH
jgi:hypothetical protein